MSERVKFYHDPRPDQPEEIETYLQCARCLDELPLGVAPRDWARLNFGITKDGAMQLWCVRHDCNVDIIGTNKRSGIDYGDEMQTVKCSCCGEERSCH